MTGVLIKSTAGRPSGWALPRILVVNYVLTFSNSRCHGNKGPSEIYLMTPLNCLTAKTPCVVQESRLCLFSKPSYSYFCAKIRYHGNKGRSEL